MTIYFCDIEGNGLLVEKDGNPPISKLHCMSVKALGWEPVTYTDIDTLRGWLGVLRDNTTLVLHNGFGYDMDALVKLGVISGYNLTTFTLPDGTIKNVQIIDTLALSREWWPDNPRGHGLEAWAKYLGTHKPEIEDWHNLPIEEYIDRCENDVITTEKVFEFLIDKLGVTYAS